jgi:hypothetical protein
MAKVRMLVTISGGRADGSEWPRTGQILECGDAEAAELCLGGNAEPCGDPLDAPVPDGDATAAPAPDGEPSEPEEGSDGDTDPSKPRVRDPKEAWEMHAMTVHGVDINTARSMTKADLVAKFGSTV